MPERKENSGDSGGSGGSGSTAATDLSQGTPDSSVVLPRLVPPSQYEANWYYDGVLARPRLVGRTSAGIVPWVPPVNHGRTWPDDPLYEQDPAVRKVTPIGGPHRALSQVEGILPQLKDAIHVLPWTSIDLFRIGSSKAPLAERPVTLWIGVGGVYPVPWDNVALALRQVRRVLDSVGLTDVECEMREAHTMPLVSGTPPVFPPVGRETFSGEWRAKRHMSTTLGQTMIPSLPADKTAEGTLGAYLRPANKPHAPIWALTCRHVCLPLAHHKKEQYRQSHAAGEKHHVYSPSDKVLDDAVKRTERSLETGKKKLQELQERARQDPTDAAAAAFLQEQMHQITSIRTTLVTLGGLRSWEDRVIGSVFFSPPIAALLGPNGVDRWTRDWGLVRLRDDKFPAEYTKNVVDLRETAVWDDESDVLAEFLAKHSKLPPNFALPENGLLPIAGVVPMAELLWVCTGRADRPVPFWLDPSVPDEAKKTDEVEKLKRAPPMFNRDDDRALIVGKRGRTTGLTWGALSEFRSVVRTPYETGSFESRELAILGSLDDQKKPFSSRGDSGALVFDVTGRAVALLTAGSRAHEGLFDVTYSSPMELVLGDISRELGEEVVLV